VLLSIVVCAVAAFGLARIAGRSRPS
jgi:hypothetical protein